MASSLSPTDALSPEGFYSLYLGGLAIESERRRRDACYVLLLMGRLGIRSDELGHLHDDWVDWSRGELYVPARDPCACHDCWQRARARKGDHDTRPLEEIVRTTCWSPPEGDAAARTLTFGWSQRLTAALDGILGQRPYLDMDNEEIEELIQESAENAWELDAGAVSPDVLRATAAAFLGSAGFGPRRLMDLLVLDEERAGEFARVGGGELREYLYRSLGPDAAPDICGSDSEFRLVCDPAPFDREPFDPRSYDARWRARRGEESTPRGRSPRPAESPTGSAFDPATDLERREPDGDSQLVSTSLVEWVRRRESQREQYAAVGSPGTGTEDGEIPEYRDQLTAPIQYSVSTRFAGQGIEKGRPTGGSVVLGQRELVFLSRDETGIAETLRVPFSDIIDIAPGYVPGPLKNVFDETVGIARHDDHGDRKIVVCELPDEIVWEFQQSLFASILDQVETVFASFAENSADPDEIDPETRILSTTSRTVKLSEPDSERLPTRIRLSTIVGIEEKPMETEVGYERGLTVHYLQVNARIATVELRPTNDIEKKLLKRYLMEYHDRQKQKAKTASLSDEQREVLDALHDAGEGRNLVAILDMNPSRVSTIVTSLKELGLARDSRTGVALTGTGYLVTSGGTLLYEASDR